MSLTIRIGSVKFTLLMVLVYTILHYMLCITGCVYCDGRRNVFAVRTLWGQRIPRYALYVHTPATAFQSKLPHTAHVKEIRVLGSTKQSVAAADNLPDVIRQCNMASTRYAQTNVRE